MLQTIGVARLTQVTEGSWDPAMSANSISPRDLQDQQFVFLSHGDKHPAFVQQLISQLFEAGVACYSDRSVTGQDFYSRIQVAQETILRCSCFVVLISRQTMSSEIVRDQLAFAEDKARPIFPIILNDLEPGLDKRYSLVRSELFHFMANGMSFKASFNQLVSALRVQCFADEPDESYGSVTGSEAGQTRNLDSIEGLEDTQLDLSSTRIRM
ncbi:unnamed protein product [Phytophthora lilii]|uniref:Unnamed protein product n=1 Tax=Phytophthora lilii TaxID=2077276 RepID=A0A9W6UF52_9STRA|nr:unnamed protein product [Phytophthora lilii]